MKQNEFKINGLGNSVLLPLSLAISMGMIGCVEQAMPRLHAVAALPHTETA